MQPAAEGLGTFMGRSQWTHEQCVRGGRTRGLQQRVAALPRWRIIAGLVEAGAGVRETCRQVACVRAAYYRGGAVVGAGAGRREGRQMGGGGNHRQRTG